VLTKRAGVVVTVAKHATLTAAGIKARSRDGGWRRAAMAAKEEAVTATRGRAATAVEDCRDGGRKKMTTGGRLRPSPNPNLL
jgi:hypothetical protein